MTEKPPLIILTGPTAIGKSRLSIALAESLRASIVSADSMQVYRGMDIGTAKMTREEMRGIPHYLIDCIDPDEPFHVVRFQKMAKDAIAEIFRQHRIPMIVGGTGFYIQAILYDIDFTEQPQDEDLRKSLLSIAQTNGPLALHERLAAVDPKSAEMIHPNNIKRTIRALEFYETTGTPISDHNEEQRKRRSPYDFRYFVLTDDMQSIYDNIENRVDQMLKNGLLDEVFSLREKGYRRDLVSMQGLGYKELLSYFDGEISLDEAIYILKRDTRHFAKRQMTWFRRERDVTFIDKRDFNHDTDRILAYLLEKCRPLIQK